MAIVLLDNISRSDIVAQNLLVRRAATEEILLVFSRMELDAVRDFLVGEAGDAFARLRVPQPHHAIISRADKLRPGVVECGLADGARVTVERAQHAALAVELPQLDLLVHAAREHQMARLGQKQHRVDALGVPRPLVDLALGQEALCGRLSCRVTMATVPSQQKRHYGHRYRT